MQTCVPSGRSGLKYPDYEGSAATLDRAPPASRLAVVSLCVESELELLLRPYWTRFRASVKLLTDSVGWGMFAWLCKANIVAEITVKNVPAEKTLQITNAINLWMGRSFPVIITIALIIAATDVYRILRVKKGVALSFCFLASVCGIATSLR